MMTMGPRLDSICSLLCPGEVLADIGTDHGYLMVNILIKGLFQRALGVELNCGPMESARQTVREAGLHDRVDLRLGDGLTPLVPGEADALVVAGMGGHTICTILRNGVDRLAGVRQMVLQPQSAHPKLRRCLRGLGWKIADERLVTEDGRLYLVLSAVPGDSQPLSWEDEQIGPVLRRSRPPLYAAYVEQMITERKRIVRSMSKAVHPDHGRIRLLCDEMDRLKEQLE